MLKREILDSNDTLYFPKQIVYRDYQSICLAIAVDTANWIILDNQYQKDVLQKLINGMTIGSVVLAATTKTERKHINNLLSKIIARHFASKNHIPNLQDITVLKSINIYLTNECNLRCRHCFMNSGSKMKDELNTEEWLRVLSDLKKAGGEYITISGGEPLMQEDFEKIVKCAADLGINITVLTNGTLWSDSLIDRLSIYISEVQISIDGIDEISNSIVRGVGYYEKAMNSVIRFANNGVRTSVATTFVFENLEFAEKYQQLIDEIASKTKNQVSFKLSKKILKGRGTNYNDEDNRRFYKIVNAIEKRINSNSSLNNFIINHEPNVGFKNCGFGGLSIAANGDVYFCNRISEIEKYGNIRKEQLEYFFNIGCEVNSQTSVDNIRPCSECELRYICGGGCRIDDFNFKGVLNGEQNYEQIKCNELFKESLVQKMAESFSTYYKF